MVSQILVPMDDSDHASQALEYALDNYPTGEITVLHVVGVPSMMMGEATALALENDISEGAAKRSEPFSNVLTRSPTSRVERSRRSLE